MLRRDEPAPGLYRWLHDLLGPLLTRLIPVTIEGGEHIPRQGPAILASNHVSYLDTVLLPAALDRPIFFFAKDAYHRGWRRAFFAGAGTLPVVREGGPAGQASLERGLEVLGRGQLLGVYPEGTRSPDGRLYRGKTGAARLALQAGVPMVPVAMIGTYDLAPRGRTVPRLRPVTIRFGAPLRLPGFAPPRGPRRAGSRADAAPEEAARDATDELMRRIGSLSGQAVANGYAAEAR